MKITNAYGHPSRKSLILPETIKNGLPIIAILTAVLLWGGSFVAMRIAVWTLSPWTVMWIRMMTASVLVLPFFCRMKPLNYRKGDWKMLILMVMFQPCFYFFLEANALRFTTSSQAGVVAASVPLFVGVGAWLMLKEAITRFMLIGVVLSIGGVVGLTLLGADDDIAKNLLLGNTLEFCAMICAAANMLIEKQLSRHYNPWALTALQVFAGALFFIPGLPLLFTSDTVVWRADLIISLLFLGFFVTLGAFGLYNWGMSRITASRASVYINLVPVTAVVLGWSILGETLTGAQCLAALAVLVGVAVSQYCPKRSKSLFEKS